VFRIDFGATEVRGMLGGFLQQGLGVFADAAGQPAAATARRARCRGGWFAKRRIDHFIGIGCSRCRLFSDAEEIAAQKIFKQAAARAEKGFQRGNGAFLLAHQLAVVIVTQQHGGEATIEIGFHPRGGGLAAELTLLPGHADAP